MNLTTPAAKTSLPWGTILGYVLMLGLAAAAYYGICEYGEVNLDQPITATSPVSERPAAALPHATPSVLLKLLIALVAVIATGLVLGRLFARLGQPPVIGEVVAGILLGPSLLGIELSSRILPPQVAPLLGSIAQLGVILFMFLVGTELNMGALRNSAHTVIAISHASIVVPFVCGGLLALALYPRFAETGVTFTNFALFLGVGLSITAFPVLARILKDRHLTHTKLGGLALNCAAVGDVSAWCLLAMIVGVVQSQSDSGLGVIAGTLVYIIAMLVLVRPVVAWFVRHVEPLPVTRNHMAAVFIGLLCSAMATEAIGIHALFGAFVFGAMIPHESKLAKSLMHQMEHIVGVLLLPAFFAFVGMRTSIQLVNEGHQWLWTGVIILVATCGKFGGTIMAARLTGLGWRDGAVLGALMNTRGLMELIVLSVGLDLGIISPTLFAMLVIMALVTTIITGPLLDGLRRSSQGDALFAGHPRIAQD